MAPISHDRVEAAALFSENRVVRYQAILEQQFRRIG
jgi:hypothetical protein